MLPKWPQRGLWMPAKGKQGYRATSLDLYPCFSSKAWSKINCTDQSKIRLILDQVFEDKQGYRSLDLYPCFSWFSWSVPPKRTYRSGKLRYIRVQIKWSVPHIFLISLICTKLLMRNKRYRSKFCNFSTFMKSKVQIKLQNGTTDQGIRANGRYRSSPGKAK